MTTAERAKELAASFRTDPALTMPVWAEREEITIMIDAYARMMGAALPERYQAISDWHFRACGGDTDDDIAAPAHRDRATLLDSVRVLTAERDGHESDSAQRWQRIIATEKERDTARAELRELQGVRDFMRKCFEGEREAMMGKVFDLRAKVVELGGKPHEYAMGATTETERLAADLVSARAEVEQLRKSNRQLAEVAELANGSLTKRTQELAAAEERADRLADGVRLMSGDHGYNASAIISWKKTNGHLVTK